MVGPSSVDAERVAAQPKPLALLAYLTAARPYGPQPREAVLPLLWPESDAKRARDSLRQALRALRQSLGHESLVSQGSAAVAIAEGYVWSDVREFDRRLDGGDLAGALDLYRGDLLAGFSPARVAPEFEHWLDQQRTRFRQRACEAARVLTESDRSAASVRWARLAVELDPFDEGALRRLLDVLAREGDLAGAIAEYERFVRHLHAVHETVPSSSTQAAIEDIRDRLAAIEAGSPDARGREGTAPAPFSDAAASLGPPNGTEAAPAPGTSRPEPPTERPSTEGGVHAPGSRPSPRRPRARPLLLIGLLLALAAAATLLVVRREKSRPVSSGTVAVLPFRVGGADASLGYLREGMVDLLATRFDGDAVPRAVGARQLIAAWRDAVADPARDVPREVALDVAERVSASEAIIGAVVGSPGGISISASLVSVPDARVLAHAQVNGPSDSLSILADRLAAELVLKRAGNERGRVLAARDVRLPALRAYLRADARYRRGDYGAALRGYEQALETDSTFALAAVGALSAHRWSPDGATDPRETARAALRTRERLSERDRVLLSALLSGVQPAPAPIADQLELWERVVEVQPENADAWYWVGDLLYHWGSAVGLPSPLERARGAFERAIALDPRFEAAVQHRIELAVAVGDREGAERLFRSWEAIRAPGEPDLLRASLESEISGEPVAAAFPARLGRASALELARAVAAAQVRGNPLGSVVDSVLARSSRTVADVAEEILAHMYLYPIALNAGRTGEVRRIADRLDTVRPGHLDGDRMLTMAALYSDGDPEHGARAAGRLWDRGAARMAQGGRLTRVDFAALCVAEQWRIRHGDTSTASRSIRILAADPGPDEEPGAVQERQVCAEYLTALRHLAEGDPAGAVPTLERLSRELRPGVYGGWGAPHLANLALAEAYRALGRPREALLALRRRPNHARFGLPYLSTFLLEEARLAEAVGDTAGAVRAYRHYLALRPKSAPTREAGGAAARARLRALERREVE